MFLSLIRKCFKKESIPHGVQFFKLSDDVKPEWRVLYKPPLSKRTGDLQWRILHGAIAVNSFISVLDSKNDPGCSFCFKKENVVHAFMYCFRLKLLFLLVQEMCDKFNESFYPETFIFDFKYAQKKRIVFQLLNFILGQAKLAIYMSRKSKLEQGCNDDVVMALRSLLKARIMIDFSYYNAMNDLFTFKTKWCSHVVLYTIDGE